MPKRLFALLAGLALGSGCSAMHTIRGVPAAYMPPEYRAESREGKATIDLSLLQRSQSNRYQIEAGDVLAVYAPGLLGLVNTQPDLTSGDNPPINLPINLVDRPSLGFPVTVRDDQTIQLPQLPAIDVYGLTEREVEDRLKQAVQQTGLLAKNAPPRIVVSVMRPRTYRVLVCRQEAATAPTPTMMAGTIDIGRAGKGTSRVVDLRAGENDVAHALAQPGVDGLPGVDARNIIYVIRSRNARHRAGFQPRMESQPTPVSQLPGRHSMSGPVVRGQSPSRGWGYSTPRPSGQIAYTEATQFNLSGRDILQGSTGPALIQPIGRMAGNSPGTTPAAGYGHSGPSGSQFSDPTYSARHYAGPSGPQFAPDQSGAAPQRTASTAPSAYMPVQYAAPAYSPSQTSPLPTSPPVGPSPVMSPPVMGSSVMESPAFNSPIAPRYPVNSAPVMMNQGPMNQGLAPPMPQSQMAPPAMQPQFAAPETYQPEPSGFQNPSPAWQQTLQNFDPTVQSSHIIKIPVRLAPGESLDLSEEDITLYDGDIIFIENRDTDVYFIGGLLGGGQYPLPRDRDLHVLEAVSLAQGRGATQVGIQGLQSSGGVSALNRDVVPGASRLLILRDAGCNRRITIEVDLYKALRYPHENILVRPSDLLILQYTPTEAVAAFLQRNVLEGALLGIAAGSLRTGGSK